MQFYQHPSRQGSTKTKSKGSTKTEKKYFTLLPEASITSAHIRLDTVCIAHIAKMLNVLTGAGKELAEDRELVWSSLFDLKKMKQLKKKWDEHHH